MQNMLDQPHQEYDRECRFRSVEFEEKEKPMRVAKHKSPSRLKERFAVIRTASKDLAQPEGTRLTSNLRSYFYCASSVGPCGPFQINRPETSPGMRTKSNRSIRKI
jgi:hypothetical protein